MLDHDTGEDARMRARLAAIGEELRLLAAPPGRTALPAGLAERARRAYRARRLRERHLPGTLFGEPAWDMLLDLLIAADAGRDISVSSACIAANVPATTALRWLQVLEAEGLIERHDDAHDARRRFVRLTEAGVQRVAACLAEE